MRHYATRRWKLGDVWKCRGDVIIQSASGFFSRYCQENIKSNGCFVSAFVISSLHAVWSLRPATLDLSTWEAGGCNWCSLTVARLANPRRCRLPRCIAHLGPWWFSPSRGRFVDMPCCTFIPRSMPVTPAMNNVFWCPQRAGNQEMLLSFQPYHYPLLHWGDLGGWIVLVNDIQVSGWWELRLHTFLMCKHLFGAVFHSSISECFCCIVVCIE